MSSATGVALHRIAAGLLRRELLLAWRRPGESLNPLLLYLLVGSLFPLGIGPDAAFLARIAAGVIWIAALLALLLSFDNLFRADHDDGTLEQFLLSPCPLYFLVLVKLAAHACIVGLPLLLATPLLGLMLALPAPAIGTLLCTLLLGVPTLVMLGGVGAALTLGLRRGGLLLSLLVLPLYVPVLIFGASAVQATQSGLPVTGHLAFIGALLAATLVTTPFAIAAALRISGG